MPPLRGLDDSTALKGKSTRPGVYWCNACQKPFSVTVGTVYESSKVPLYLAIREPTFDSSKKGISSHQLARMLASRTRQLGFWAPYPRGDGPAPNSEPR